MLLCLALVVIMGRVGEVGARQRRTNHGFSSGLCVLSLVVGFRVLPGTLLGDDVGDTLGAALGDAVGDTLGAALGYAVGDTLGVALGDAVCDTLGAALGDAVGDTLLTSRIRLLKLSEM